MASPKLQFNSDLPAYSPGGGYSGNYPPPKPRDSMGAGDTGYNSISEPPLVNSASNSPGAALEGNSLETVNLRYPLDLGTNYKHILRIFIYQQERSNFEYPIIPGDTFRFDAQAGMDKISNLDVSGSAASVATLNNADTLSGMLSKGSKKLIGKAAAAGKSGGQIGSSAYMGSGIDLSRKIKKSCAYISLFMPDSLIVSDKHDYDRVSITDALGAAGVLSNSLANVKSDSPAGTIEGMGAASKGGGAFGANMTKVALFSQGYALNPQMEILYKETQNRKFQYMFKFVPRNSDETYAVESIIRTLRFHAAPEYDPSNVSQSRFFIPPSEFEIEYYIGEATNNTHIPRIAKCVLNEIDVNYSPNNHYSTFYDGAPTEITLQLTFTETVVLTKNDIMMGY